MGIRALEGTEAYFLRRFPRPWPCLPLSSGRLFVSRRFSPGHPVNRVGSWGDEDLGSTREQEGGQYRAGRRAPPIGR